MPCPWLPELLPLFSSFRLLDHFRYLAKTRGAPPLAGLANPVLLYNKRSLSFPVKTASPEERLNGRACLADDKGKFAMPNTSSGGQVCKNPILDI